MLSNLLKHHECFSDKKTILSIIFKNHISYTHYAYVNSIYVNLCENNIMFLFSFIETFNEAFAGM